ncbi:hypothetical protein COCNU_06G018250 [Cocos nucifera]|uniref:Uncharacterized protein n=1 Tax=Cocos nucifera TaxID=13894 RepID=A0A8K0ID01_COCNU|nr:hypothetical protein COCNU_06G018250 [Cocos nucifera]
MARSGDLGFALLAFRSELTEKDLIVIHSQFNIPPEFKLEVPKPEERVCNPPPGRIGGLSSLKALGPKVLQKRKADATRGRSIHPRVELLPVLPAIEIEGSDPHNIEDLQIEPTNGEETAGTTANGAPFIEGAEVSETVLGGTPKTMLGKESVAETSGTTSIRVEVQAFALDDYSLACEAFTNFLYLADASKLLVEPLKMRRKALDCFIRLAHYLNEFMENIADLSSKAASFEVEVAILKKAKDQLSKAVGEGSNRAKATEKF